MPELGKNKVRLLLQAGWILLKNVGDIIRGIGEAKAGALIGICLANNYGTKQTSKALEDKISGSGHDKAQRKGQYLIRLRSQWPKVILL